MPKKADIIQSMKNELWRVERRIDRLQAYVEELENEIYGLTGRDYSEPALKLYHEQKTRAEFELAAALESSLELIQNLYKLKAIELPREI